MKRPPTEMELRCVAAVLEEAGGDLVSPGDPDGTAQAFYFVRTVIRALIPDLATMDGGVMNAMCDAFEGRTHNDGNDGLTAACTRAVTAYIDAASPPEDA